MHYWFGESFETADPPKDFGTPISCCSPELILEKQKAGQGSDIWALACTIFEIRTGRKLFDNYDDDIDEYLETVVLMLGKLPEARWTSWEGRKALFGDKADDQVHVVKLRRPARRDESADDLPPTHYLNGIPIEPRSIREALAPGIYYKRVEPGTMAHLGVSKLEVEVMSDLLSKMLQHDPKQRLSVRDTLTHEWFNCKLSDITSKNSHHTTQ